MRPATRHQRGIVLVVVLFFVLLTVSGVATFLRRASIDGMIARNRDHGARAEASARGGIQLATALLLEDRLAEQDDLAVESRDDLWARVGATTATLPAGEALTIRIEDAGARLNLNALFEDGEVRDELTELYLTELLRKVVEEMPGTAEETFYDAEELARNLIDWIDADDVQVLGGSEDELYQAKNPPYRAPNRPLLSLEELGLVEGFDPRLVEALRPYLGVHPIVDGDGINPNTAPPWVLALLYAGTSGDYRLIGEEEIRRILDIREGGGILCADEANHPDCTPLREAIDGEVYPPPSFTGDVFRVRAEARSGEVVRHIEAVIDRGDPEEIATLSWRLR